MALMCDLAVRGMMCVQIPTIDLGTLDLTSQDIDLTGIDGASRISANLLLERIQENLNDEVVRAALDKVQALCRAHSSRA